MKLFRRRFIDYPIKDFPGSTVQQIGHKKFGDTTNTFMSISTPLSSDLLRNGCDPYTLQQILGHTTMEMTRRYLKIANSDIEKSLKSFSPAEQIDIRL